MPFCCWHRNVCPTTDILGHGCSGVRVRVWPRRTRHRLLESVPWCPCLLWPLLWARQSLSASLTCTSVPPLSSPLPSRQPHLTLGAIHPLTVNPKLRVARRPYQAPSRNTRACGPNCSATASIKAWPLRLRSTCDWTASGCASGGGGGGGCGASGGSHGTSRQPCRGNGGCSYDCGSSRCCGSNGPSRGARGGYAPPSTPLPPFFLSSSSHPRPRLCDVTAFSTPGSLRRSWMWMWKSRRGSESQHRQPNRQQQLSKARPSLLQTTRRQRKRSGGGAGGTRQQRAGW
jgi:hypothetical protein